MPSRPFLFLLCLCLPFAAIASADEAKLESEWAFLDNGAVRLGVKRGWGAGIGWFSESGSERNLVNHWDHGRLIQQSYYGEEDGSLWNDKPWRWNPVQGGDWKGNPAKVLELTVDADKHTLYAKSMGKHWAAGDDLKDVVFEQWISLDGPVAKIRFRFTYSGDTTHPERDHEIPAVFLAPDLDTLVVYDGDKPWSNDEPSRSIPGWPNESRNMVEHWAAYVGAGRDFGVGVYVPVADALTCYRFGDGKPEHGSCSYFAPLTKFAIAPGKVFEYDIFLTLGSIGEMRQRFRALHESARPFEFTRMLAHWDAYGDPDYLPFIEDAKPDLVQVGFYGAHFWSLVHTPEFGGYPAHFPVRGLTEASEWFQRLNAEIHQRDTRVVGHFNVEFLVGDPDGPDGPRGFFKWYRELWDESVLGPKPVEDPLDLLEKNADGTPIINRSYAIGGMNEYWACLRNPAWQQVLKAWLRRGIDLGLDGYVINYFYRHDCHCPHCRKAFRDYLRARFDPASLRGQFGIADLDSHVFDEIVSWHDPAESTPLRREMLRFSQVSNKEVFDEVFVRYGRSLRPGLILAQWNHLGDFSAISGDERCLLPDDLWGRDESYLWYSTGGSANFTDLKRGFLGDATLQARYLRGAFHDKPFTLGKYEATRIRSAIAELAANGGAPMGFYTRFTDPEARREIVRYYRFLEKHDALWRGNRSYAEATLAFPRTRVHRGEVEALDQFRATGRALLNSHLLFDILPDDRPPAADAPPIVADAAALPEDRSRFEAPATIRISATRPADSVHELDFHFVNYNREEPPAAPDGTPATGNGIADEKPLPAAPVAADIRLPRGTTVTSVTFLTPEEPEPANLAWTQENGRLRFQSPRFLVYGVARVRLAQP